MSEQKLDTLLPILRSQPVIPVIKIDRLADVVPLARALARGGLPAIEITLRTPVALEAIRVAATEAPEAVVGAGTILDPRQFQDAERAGARFIVSPGRTSGITKAASDSPVPLLPGAATPSEIMAALDDGYSMLKFFPAEQAGGATYLKSLSSPLAGVRFCPTGGIGMSNARSYLDLPNVVCIGGSWLVPDKALAEGDWNEIERLAREASGLRSAG